VWYIKFNGVFTDAIRLWLFPFSLKDKAQAWLHSLPSITTWDELTRVFLIKFFPPSKIRSLRNQITTLLKGTMRRFYDRWERFKDLLHLCPHLGLQKWMIIQTFHTRVTQLVRSTIYAVVDGNLMNKTKNEAYNLIEEMTLNNHQWSNERS